jgi:hypothetical protein
MTRTFIYRFENCKFNGEEISVESEALGLEALAHMESQFGKCTYNGWAEFMGVGKPSRLGVIGGAHTKGDGFKTGWNPALGMEIRSPEHYRRTLKEKGLVEVGNEKRRDVAPKKTGLPEEIIKQAVDAGAEISGREAEALKSGEGLGEN